MNMDPCELSPSYVRSIAPYQPGKPISELAREMGLEGEGHRQARLERESARHRAAHARGDRGARSASIARYPDGNGFELKDALSRRYGVDMAQIVLGNGSNDVLELVALAFLGPGRAAVLLAARLRGLSARDAGARRARHRGAGEELRPRPRGDGARRSTTRPAWSGSPTRTTRPARSRAPEALEALRARACPSASSW